MPKETPILTYKGLEWRLVHVHDMGDYWQCGDHLIFADSGLRDALVMGTRALGTVTPGERREIIARGAGGIELH